MNARIGRLALLAMLLGSDSRADEPRPRDPAQVRERTSFQTHARWAPDLQLGSDVTICYGIDATLPERITGWKNQGYIPHLMTGVSWGEYQDYLYGRVRRRESRGRGADRAVGQENFARTRRLLHEPRQGLRDVPRRRGQEGDRRRGRGGPPRRTRVLGSRRLQPRLSARVARLLPRGLGRAPHLADAQYRRRS